MDKPVAGLSEALEGEIWILVPGREADGLMIRMELGAEELWLTEMSYEYMNIPLLIDKYRITMPVVPRPDFVRITGV